MQLKQLKAIRYKVLIAKKSQGSNVPRKNLLRENWTEAKILGKTDQNKKSHLPDEHSVKKFKVWGVPENQDHLYKFSDFAKYNHHYHTMSQSVAHGNNDKKHVNRQWSHDAQRFSEKTREDKPIVAALVIPADETRFELSTDASNVKLGRKLNQEKKRNGGKRLRPVCFNTSRWILVKRNILLPCFQPRFLQKLQGSWNPENRFHENITKLCSV